jgi:mannose-1-phosphate guanylyltransferase
MVAPLLLSAGLGSIDDTNPAGEQMAEFEMWMTTGSAFETGARFTQVRESPRPRPGAPDGKPAALADPDAAPPIDTRWVVVLAGGEGRRISALTCNRHGTPVPKQFCRFRDERTLLATTVERALQIVPRDRVVVVVQEAHRRWWEPELEALPPENVLAQPINRGTAVAIVHGLFHILLRHPGASVVVMPSDHDLDDERPLLRAIDAAHDTAVRFPFDIVTLGIAPTHLDCGYGLIVPGTCTDTAEFLVGAFVEKPTLTVAAQLLRRGAMWNSFIFASTGTALRERFEETLPALMQRYRRILGAGAYDVRALTALYESLSETDFSRDVLQRSATRLRVVAVPSCGWTDLGTPARLASWLDRHREARFWSEQRLPRQSGSTVEGFSSWMGSSGA